MGSPPPTRGAQLPHEGGHAHERLIPAYAGSTSAHCSAWSTSPAHPRLRGEHITSASPGTAELGSSPLTRGTLVLEPVADQHGGLIPAYAGSTTTLAQHGSPTSAHPRLRGEHWCRLRFLLLAKGSSPLTRGARDGQVILPTKRRLIPAYAGSTLHCQNYVGSRAAHPRLRGEHPSCFTCP